MLGGSTTVDTSTTVNADIGVNIEGISLGGGVPTTTDNNQTVSQSQMFDVPAGRQAIMTIGVTFHSQTGNVQVNYGDRVNGHFIVNPLLLSQDLRLMVPSCFSGSLVLL